MPEASHAYRVANQQRMALKWIGTLKAWLVCRYEISDLFTLLHQSNALMSWVVYSP